MRRRRSRRRELHPSGPPTREEIDALEERIRYVEGKANMGRSISGVLSGEPDVDDSYQYDWEGNAATSTEAVNSGTVGGYTVDEIPYITDTLAPSSSPTPTVAGGPRFLSVKWPVAANADLATYEVHVIDGATRVDSSWVADATTLVGETPGLLAFIYKAADDSPLAYDTDYYVKIIAKDDDGAAAAGTETGPTQLDPNGSADILAGAITAEHVEAVFAMASAFVAGTPGATNVQVGYGIQDDGAGGYELDSAFVGVRSYDTDGTTITFQLDADTGEVLLRGRVFWGTGSELRLDDILEIKEQSTNAFMTSSQIQAVSRKLELSSTLHIERSWLTRTDAGNLLLAAVFIRDVDDNANVTPDDAAWIEVGNIQVNGNGQVYLFAIEDAGSRFGDERFNFSNAVNGAVLRLAEFSGVELQDIFATDSGTSSTPLLSTDAVNTTQNDELWFAALAQCPDSTAEDGVPTSLGAGWSQIGSNLLVANMGRFSSYQKVATATGVASFSATLEGSQPWFGIIATFKAKATAAVLSPDADSVRVYAKDVGTKAALHVLDEEGVEGSVVTGPAGEFVRIARGLDNITGDGDASADVTVNHDLGVVPTTVVATCTFQDKNVAINGKTSTQITFRVRDTDGANWSTTVGIHWIAIA